MSVLAQKQRYGQCGVVILLPKPLREEVESTFFLP